MWCPLLGAAGALLVVAYAAGAPGAQLFGATFHRSGPRSRRVALTFDDGPSDEETPRLLDLLDELGVRATFFMVGRSAARRSDLVLRAARAGHEIGNHTLAHRVLPGRSSREIEHEIAECNQVLTGITGVRPALFRPPYGLRSPRVLRAARELGLRTVMWSVTCFDWQDRSAADVERIAARQFGGGDIVLLHDGDHRGPMYRRPAAVEVTARLVARCRAAGHDLVTVAELMEEAARGGGPDGSSRSC